MPFPHLGPARLPAGRMALIAWLAASSSGAMGQEPPERATAPAIDPRPTTDARLEVLGCEVERPLSPPEPDQIPMRTAGARAIPGLPRPGTAIRLLLRWKGGVVLGSSPTESALESMVDDQGVDLLAAARPRRGGPIPMMSGGLVGAPFEAAMLPDGYGYLISARGPACPSPGSRSVRIKGHLAVRVGSAARAEELRSVSLEEGTTLRLGGVDCKVTRQEATLAGMAIFGRRTAPKGGAVPDIVGLTHKGPFDALRDLSLLDDKGEVVGRLIGQTIGPDASSPLGPGGQPAIVHVTMCQLTRKVEKVDVKASYWSVVEPKTLPFDLECSIGLATPSATRAASR